MEDLHKVCKSKNNGRINGPYAFIDNVLYGFVCGLPKCNYIQLTAENLRTHLENSHHLIADDEYIIEITLLKAVQPTNLFKDNMNSESLMEAKENNSQYLNFEPIEVTHSDLDLKMRVSNLIDLTLSEDDTSDQITMNVQSTNSFPERSVPHDDDVPMLPNNFSDTMSNSGLFIKMWDSGISCNLNEYFCMNI